MFKSRAILSLAVAGLFLGGCDKEKTTPAQPSSTTPPVSTTPVIPTTPTTLPATLPTGSGVTLPEVPVVPSTLTVPTIPGVPATSTTPSVPSTGDTKADAQALISKTGTDIAAKNWDAAKADLKSLSDMKDKMSPELNDEVKKLQAAYDTSKGLGDFKLPGLPGATPTETNK